MPANFGTTKSIREIYIGTNTDQICLGYFGRNHDPFFERAGQNAPVISNFQAANSSSSGKTLTLNVTDLPASVSITADITNATSWTLTRVTGGVSSVVASSPSGEARLSYTENLATDFKPDSNGWSYNLHVENSALGNCGSRHSTIKVRVVTAPILSAMSATAPASSQGPGTFIQCSTISWSATAGDPPAAWSFSQTGFHLTNIPSSRHATPGQSPQRVCTLLRPGQTTTLTLTGTNEGGTVSRSVTIHWAGGS